MSSAFDGLPKTPNLKLNKPGYDNVADIEALNENADILDAEIQGIKNTFVKSVNGINAGDDGNVDLGIMPIAKGGTGQTTASGVRNALGLGNTTGALPVANGGTGATTAKQARENLGLATAVTGASISGQVITLTFADGTTKKLTTQDTNTPFVPDYSAGVSINFPYTAPADGYVFVGCTVGPWGSAVLTANGSAVDMQHNNTSGNQIVVYVSGFIKKDDVVKVENVQRISTEHYFYPLVQGGV